MRTGLPQLALPITYAGSEMAPVLGETEGGRKTTRRLPEALLRTVAFLMAGEGLDSLTRSLPVVARSRIASAPASDGAASGLPDFAGRLGAPRALRDLGMPESGIDQAAELIVRHGYWNPRPEERTRCACPLDPRLGRRDTVNVIR
ncbi:hypothetical protein [Streptomyces javensis]|uniref:Uncharacterized protein n=1 Tax=Streptomyces javensis TaxID=114698 RepID=A0ABS0R8T9_9ACTN|nr:hypothetical protein [Streptomyces javensis]MBI0313817.1 hypothetical protein [Streptomyces javensis]